MLSLRSPSTRFRLEITHETDTLGPRSCWRLSVGARRYCCFHSRNSPPWEVPGQYTAVAGSLVMPFLFGLWTARKVESYLVLHGLLVGAVGIVIYVGLTRGQAEPLLYIFAHGLKLLGGAAGGYLAAQKQRIVLTTSL